MNRLCLASLVVGFSALLSVQTSTAEYNLEPVYLGAVGQFKPLELYPVAVAVRDGLVYDADVFHKEIQIRNLDGVLVSKFPYQDQWPRDVAVDVAGNIYTADANTSKIRKYSPTGQLLLEVGSKGINPGQFARPLAMTLDSDGNIYVADQTTELSMFDANGNLVWNNMGEVGVEGDLGRAQGIARDSVGNLYVANSSRKQIVVFGPGGSYLRKFGPVGDGFNLRAPVAVEVDSTGFIYVLDRLQAESTIGQDQVLKFTNAGALVTSWGAKGRAPGELWEPQGLALDASGDVWVAGYQGHNIAHYDSTGNFLGEWNDHNIVPYEFAQTFGAAVGEKGRLYATDYWNQLVQVFDRYGDFLFMWGERGEGDGPYFNFPRFTALNAAGDIYIDDDNHVRRFDSNGTFLSRSGRIVFPGGMGVDDQDNVWVTGRSENAIRKYSSGLMLQQIIDGSAIPSGLNAPNAIKQNPANGLFYVADTMNHRILRLTASGAYDLSWGGFGNAPGQFRAPVGMTIDSQGHVYISETWNKRIQVFTADGGYLAGWDVPGQPEKDVGRVFELTMDGDYFLYAPDNTRGQAEVHKYALVPDVPASGVPIYQPGQDLGFYIWSDDQAHWHIRWSSDGVQRSFAGTITSTLPFNSFSAVDTDAGDQISAASGSRIDFAASEATGEDGIDIVTSGAGVIVFDLAIDGVEMPNRVTVGNKGFVPASVPLPLHAEAPVVVDQIGRPSYTAGVDRGYFIWQDADDGEWHIRWSGNGTNEDSFSGTVRALSDFLLVNPFSFEGPDNLVQQPASFSFDAVADVSEDGVDFFLPEGAEVTFELLINGVPAGNEVRIGGAGTILNRDAITLITAPAVNAPAFGIQFEDVTESAGIEYFGDSYGVSWGDVNADGWPDIWAGNHAQTPNLYVNNRDGTFADEVSRVEYSFSDRHGAAWADFDNDGDQDLLILTGAGVSPAMGRNLFFVNEGGVLKERGASYGLANPLGRGRTPLWFDWNGDGKLDVFLTNDIRPDGQAPSALFTQVDGSFVDSVDQTGLPPISTLYAQLLIIGEGNTRPSIILQGIHGTPYPEALFGYGVAPFEDLSHLMPPAGSVSDVAIADFNGDLLSDLALVRATNASEAIQTDPNHIAARLVLGVDKGFTFRADGNVQFQIGPRTKIKFSDIYIGANGIHPEDVVFSLSSTDADAVGLSEPESGIPLGVYIGYDSASGLWQLLVRSDSWLDAGIVVTTEAPITDLSTVNFENSDGALSDRLVLQSETGFADHAAIPEVGASSACRSVATADFDNDMDVDLYLVCHGSATNAPNKLYENLGNGSFREVPGSGDAAGSMAGRGESVAIADYDRDGYVDLFVTNGFGIDPLNRGPSQLFRNTGGTNHWLEVDLEGVSSNRDGVGARVLVTAGGVTQIRDQDGGIHRFSQNSQRLHFGLAEETVVDKLEVLWPGGTRQVFENITVDQIVRVAEPEPDTQPPTISITEPADGATVTGNVQVLADAFDNQGVEKVTFAIDGVWVGRDVTAPYSFNWNSVTHSNGIATVQATAFDLVGNTTTSTIFVTADNLDADGEAPSLSITEPADGATVTGNVQVLADAFDNQGVVKVTFAIDGGWVGRDVTAPYSFNWNSVTHSNGIATVQATAFDLVGNTTTSTIFVTADNPDADGEAPSLSITEPADGATVTGNVQVLADAFDNQGVEKVTFAIDGVWVGRDVTAPYSFNWNSVTHSNGIATVQATAFDPVGNTTTSTIFVTVDNL